MNFPAKCDCRFASVQQYYVGISVICAAVMAASPAMGAGWSLETIVSERIKLDDNLQLTPVNPRETYGSITSLSSDLMWKSHRLDMNFFSNFDLNRYFGPGSESNQNTFDQFHKADFHKKGKTVNIDILTSFRIQDTTTSELEDTNITTQKDNQRLTFSMNGATSYKVNDRLTASLTGSAQYVDFTKQSASLTPFMDFDLKAALARKLSNATDVTMSLSGGVYVADDTVDTTSQDYRVNSKLTTKLSQRLTVHASLGAIAIHTVKQAGVATPASTVTSFGGLADFGLSYKLKTSNISVSARQGFEPSASGEIVQRSNVGFSIAHTINSRSSISLSASGSRSKSPSSGTLGSTYFTFAPTYTYSLARNWRAGLGYTFRLRKSTTETTKSNSMYLSLTRTFSLLP